jgi:hypothetical protein
MIIIIIPFHYFCPMNFQHVSLPKLGSYDFLAIRMGINSLNNIEPHRVL